MFATVLVVITDVEQGLTTTNAKSEGATKTGEVPYVIPLTITVWTVIV